MISVAVILVVAAALGAQLWFGLQQEIRHARRLTSSMTEAVAQQIGGGLRGVTGLMEEMAAAVRNDQWGNPAQRQRFVGRLESFPEIRWIGYVTPDGRLTPDTVPSINVSPDGLDVHDREYYVNNNCVAESGLHVGEPVIGRATFSRTIHLSLPVVGASGDCRGMVVAAIDPDYYAALLQTMLLDPRGSSAVFRRDGLVVARVPNHAKSFGVALKDSPLFLEWLPRAKSGVAHITAVMDGNRKFLGYKELDRYGLVVTSGISESQALGPWIDEAAVEIPAFAVFALVIFFLAWQADHREAKLMRHKAGLEAAVSERTAALESSKILAEARAERLDRVNAKLTHLTQLTAHHLQEPVRPIVSFSQLARREIQNCGLPEVEEHLRFVEEAGRHLKAVLQGFHRYTALLAAHMRPEPVLMGRVAESVLGGFVQVLQELQAEVSVDSLPTVVADRRLMETVLRELVDNSIKFRHPDRRLRIHIEGGRDARTWWLAVSDNGVGLPDYGRHNLFQAFARLTHDQTQAQAQAQAQAEAHAATALPSSVGLGLAVCREVAEIHGGSIDYTNLDEGVRFTLTFPVEMADHRDAPRAPPSPSMVSRETRGPRADDPKASSALVVPPAVTAGGTVQECEV